MTIDRNKLTEPFPDTAIKQRQGGGNRSLSYVEGHTVIHRLIAATDNTYSFRVLKIDTRDVSTQRGTATLVMATVELEIPGLGARQHIGVQMVNDAGGEDLVKGAITDALKKAATLFGVGLELYGPDYASGELPEASQRASRPSPPLGQDVRPHEPAAPAGAATANFVTPAQIKFAMKLATDAALSDDDMRGVINEMTGKASIKEMTVREASDLISWLKAQVPEPQPALAGV